MKLPSNVEIKGSSIHNRGMFATKAIKKGERIIEYVGEKITKEEADIRFGVEGKDTVYLFEVNDDFDLDGDVDWNPARCINHSCEPNCEAINDDDHIWIEAITDIKAGDELSYNYGFGMEDYDEHPCRCGSKSCVGFIVDKDHWHKIAKRKK